MQRLLLLLTLTAMPLFSHAIEEPSYQVIKQIDTVELRHYAPYVVAEVVLDATAEDAGSRAFPILAGYIFGKNKGEKTFAMTAPVTQTAVREDGDDCTGDTGCGARRHAGAVRAAPRA